jgi:probable rRNA maturation factor
MKILINNRSSFSVEKKLVRKIVKNILKKEGRTSGQVSIVFLNSQEIREINKKYRGKDKPTDVLSFVHDGVGLEGTEIDFMGEVLISPDDSKEIIKVLIHGILHLLGYDHQSIKDRKVMEQKENLYL